MTRSSTAHIGSYSAAVSTSTFGGHTHTHKIIATGSALDKDDSVVLTWWTKDGTYARSYDATMYPFWWNGSSWIWIDNKTKTNTLSTSSSWVKYEHYVTDITGQSTDPEGFRVQFQTFNIDPPPSSVTFKLDDVRLYSSGKNLPPCGHAKPTKTLRWFDNICNTVKYQSEDEDSAYIKFMYEDPDDGLYYLASDDSITANVSGTGWHTYSGDVPLTTRCKNDLNSHHNLRILTRVYPQSGNEEDHINEKETKTLNYTQSRCYDQTGPGFEF
jgi:hypothetical protein